MIFIPFPIEDDVKEDMIQWIEDNSEYFYWEYTEWYHTRNPSEEHIIGVHLDDETATAFKLRFGL